jgi:hypothetical protein
MLASMALTASIARVSVVFFAVSASIAACSDDPPPPRVENAGSSCTAPEQCYPNVVDGGVIKGTVTCITKVTGGYCSHTCETDADCCAVEGECRSNFKQVCSPLTNETTPKYCLLSCEAVDITASGDPNATEANYCQTYASQYMGCRSSGGGVENRKVCLP